MEGQTNCVLCDYKSRSIGSLKQHMESKHNVFNMTIVQVLTQQVERVNTLEREINSKEQLIEKAEVDLNVAKEALKKEKASLEVKEKALDDLINLQKFKADEELKLVEELKATKDQLNKAHQDLEIKSNAVNEELEKVKVTELSTQTVYDINEFSDFKQEVSEAHVEEKHNVIPCKYFHKVKGCRRGSKCWFYHDENHCVEKKSLKLKQNPNKTVKGEPNLEKEAKKEPVINMKKVILELVKLLLGESNM